MEKHSAAGNPLRVYDIERTVCDMVRGSISYDIQISKQALKVCIESPDKDMERLASYAKRLRIDPRLLRYIELLNP
jgi:hypothetical protein